MFSKRFGPRIIHEARSVIPNQWDKRLMLDKSRIIPVRINLAQNLEGAEDLLMEVSHPDSPKYAQHYNADEVADLFAPTKETIDIVLDWLRSEGHDVDHSHYNHWKAAVVVPMPIHKAENLLHATYDAYEHTNGKVHIACMNYSLPEAVRHHVDFVLPTVHFDVHTTPHAPTQEEKRDPTVPSPGKLKDKSPVLPKQGATLSPQALAPAGSLSKCDQQITPDCLRALYGIKYTQKAVKKNSFGIVEYTPQSYIPGDLDLFAKKYVPGGVGRRPKLLSIDGGQISSVPKSFDLNGESDLDLEYGMALTFPLRVSLYQAGDKIFGASFNTFLDALDNTYCAGDDPTQDPHYPDPNPGGYKGKDCGKYAPTHVIRYYEKRQCNEYLKLGLRGVTVVYSSGDYGVAGNGGNCIDASGHLSPSGLRFNPSFPSTCPYITSIGATQIKPGNTVAKPEEAAETVIFSGGGFSNVFPMPTYQKAAIKYYYKHHKPTYSSSQYNNNQKARGFPDISANGVNYVVAVDGAFSLVYGTSASAPVVGSIFALINDARLAHGKKPIGFVNPTLYAHPSAFNDITSGNNPGCSTQGFTAVKGWDPVTGLGTPSFPKLLKLFLSLK
ncbi:hypothetical protein BS47DRAFT_1336132 [Hydnum rufescens UP504]|uniref:tripeptidyl-peptidase II n=1 Tax=Hydnum rufescens UP504 TaxID=1448309 RepID=A0A9P6E1Z6_9AGAM|nr:hypothetical protein BS47DRAFT_1336132 [Hydnum rufescens UP504]